MAKTKNETANEAVETAQGAGNGTETTSQEGTPTTDTSTIEEETEKPDRYGNPAGTMYNEKGQALPLDEGLNDAPNSEDFSVVYNEDGSVWAPPKDVDEKIASINHQLSGVKIEISKNEQLLESTNTLISMQPDELKPAFQKAADGITLAIDSRKEMAKDLELQLVDLRLSKISPAQKAVEVERSKLIEDKKKIEARLAEIEEIRKGWGIQTSSSATPRPKSTDSVTASDEQKSNHAYLVNKHGSQGKAIVELVKKGWLNFEIAKHMGIAPASIPGPKNTYLRSEEGQKLYELGTNERCKMKGQPDVTAADMTDCSAA